MRRETTTRRVHTTPRSVMSLPLCLQVASQPLAVALLRQAQHPQCPIANPSYSRAHQLILSRRGQTLNQISVASILVHPLQLRLNRSHLTVYFSPKETLPNQSLQSQPTSSLQSLHSVHEAAIMTQLLPPQLETSSGTMMYENPWNVSAIVNPPATLRKPTLRTALKRNLWATRS